jgi:hypothetical protein
MRRREEFETRRSRRVVRISLYPQAMSIWTRPLFGTGRVRAQRAHSEAGKRLARVRASRALPQIRAIAIYGLVVFSAFLVVGVSLDWRLARSSATLPGGAPLPPFWTWLSERSISPQVIILLALIGAAAVAGPALWRWSFDRALARSTTRSTTAERARATRLGQRILKVEAVAVPVLLIGSAVTIAWQVPLALFALFGLIFAPLLIVLGLFHRRGRGLRCARCDYRMMSWRADAPVCPECGLEWRKPWNLRWGRRCICWPMVAGGAAIAIFAAAALVLVIVSLMR